MSGLIDKDKVILTMQAIWAGNNGDDAMQMSIDAIRGMEIEYPSSNLLCPATVTDQITGQEWEAYYDRTRMLLFTSWITKEFADMRMLKIKEAKDGEYC